MFREYLSGKCRRDIAGDLRKEGVPKRTGATDWRPTDVTLLLKNEKYAGNALLQKTYSSGCLPFRTVRNRGEQPQYFVQGSHPAIVSQEDFDRARALAERRKHKKAPPTVYPFTRRMACAHCGATMKRRLQNGRVTWICYNHYEDKDFCPVLPIAEGDIEDVFVLLWNKLHKNRRYILGPLLTGLREIRLRTSADPAGLDDLNRQIAEINGQVTLLAQIRAKGYLDEALYIAQVGELESRLGELRFRRKVLLRLDEDDPTLADVEKLLEIMETAEPLDAFDAAAFLSITDNIIADNTELRFRLSGELELCERYGERGGVPHEEPQHPVRVSDERRRDHTA